MGPLRFLRRLLGHGAGSTEQAVTSPDPKQFDLQDWIQTQEATYGGREGVAEEIERRAEQAKDAPLGLSGSVMEELLRRHPRLVPKEFWGGSRGWPSAKREAMWRSLIHNSGIATVEPARGMLIRFYIDASQWVPHPYAPPHWTTYDYAVFSQYVVPNEKAFRLCVQWMGENSTELTSRLRSRLGVYPVQIAARYWCQDRTDHADVAFVLPSDANDLLFAPAPWKGRASLTQLVLQLYPDAICEYSPLWLAGQRVDIFIPSLQVGIEYHGEQHYRPIEHFGGRKALRATRVRDKRKAEACKKNGVVLVEWKHSERISKDAFRRKLAEFGITVAIG